MFLQKKNKTRKITNYNIQKGGNILSLLEEDNILTGAESDKYIKYNLIGKYFNLNNNSLYQRFVMTSLKYCLSIFSTINWTSQTEYSSSNNSSSSNSNSNESKKNNNYSNIIKTKTKKPKHYNKHYNLKKNNKKLTVFNNNAVVLGLRTCSSDFTNSYKPPEFINIGMYSKAYGSGAGFTIKCILYKKTDTNNFYIIFMYGETINFYNYNLSIKKVCRFIYKKLKEVLLDNLVLFGFSMGGNIAQHVALEFLKDEKTRIPSNKITLINLSSGKNIKKDDYELILEKLKNRFLSFSLISFEDESINYTEIKLNNNNNKKNINIKIDKIFNSESIIEEGVGIGVTLPTILILIDKDLNPINYYDYDYIKSISNIKFINDLTLHDFNILKKCLCI